MDERDSIDELHDLAEYRRARKIIRTSGWGALVVGCINALIAYTWIQHNFIVGSVIALIAAALLIIGFWELLLPMAEAIIFDGIIAIVIGLLDLVITVANAAAGGNVRIQWGIFGGFIIAWGVSRFISYRRLSEALRHKPEPGALDRLDAIVEKLKKLKSKDAPDVIGFRVPQRFMRPQQDWKGQLGSDAAIFIDKRGHDVMVAHKDDVEIEVTGKVLIGKTLKVSVRVAEHSMPATMSPDSFERYEDWKEREEDEIVDAELAEIEPSTEAHNPDKSESR
jgi:hypothetical protein